MASINMTLPEVGDTQNGQKYKIKSATKGSRSHHHETIDGELLFTTNT